MARVWLKPDTTKTMSSEEAAWLAGFIDGEGTIKAFRKERGRNKIAWVIAVSNTDKESLEYCKEITGVGGLIFKKVYKDTHKDQYQWRVQSQRNIRGILLQIQPYCRIKGPNIERFFSEWEDIK